MKVTRFTSGSQQLCVECSHVRGVVSSPQLSPVPGAPPWLVGAYNHLGRAVAAIDVPRFNSHPTPARRVGWLVLVDTQGELVGLVADTPPADHDTRPFPRRGEWIEVADVRADLLWIDLGRFRDVVQAVLVEAKKL